MLTTRWLNRHGFRAITLLQSAKRRACGYPCRPEASLPGHRGLNPQPLLMCWILLLQTALALPCTSAQDPQDPLLTVAESSQFKATASGQQVLDFLNLLGHQWDAAELHTVGTTIEGRTIQALVVDSALAKKAEDQPANDQPVNELQPDSTKQTTRPLNVLILGGIHPGECDGKESLLAYMRDLSRQTDPSWFRPLRLVFIPNYNADGDARRGTEHRPGQSGPEQGMGIRENAIGLDLNRDFIKLESPETRSLVAIYNQFDIDVLIDLHTTNGSLHRYQLTYDIPHNPAASPALDQYLRGEMLPKVTDLLRSKGFETFYYGNFDRAHRRWESYGYEPRYSTEYMGLRGKIGILVESYSYANYETRFLVNYAFIDEVLRHLAANYARLVTIIDQQREANIVGSEVPISAELAQTQEAVQVLGYRSSEGLPPVGPYDDKSAAKYQPHDYSVQLWNRAIPKKTVKLPVAYAIPSQHAWAVSRLLRHGLPIYQLTEQAVANAEVATITSLKSVQQFQGHSLQKLTVQWSQNSCTLAAGTYIIPANGGLARLAAFLLEPESDESLATWNFLDPYLIETGQYPVIRLGNMPEAIQQVDHIAPGEVLTVDNTMKLGSSVHAGGPTALNETPYWLPESSEAEYAQVQQGQLFVVQAATGDSRRLGVLKQLENKLAQMAAFTAAEAKAVAASSDFWRSRKKQALLKHKQDLYFYDVDKQVVRQLTHTPDQPELFAELSPSGQYVAFVRDNNLWMVDCETTELRQLTNDGTPQLLNGVLDWVYQEELYGRGNFKAFWWSPNSEQIAFLQLDQTPVPEYMVADNVSIAQSLEQTRYPKAGQPLPTAKAMLIEIRSGTRQEINLSQFPPEDRLIGRVTWSPQNDLWLQLFNRVQNRQELLRYQPTTGHQQVVLKEQSPGWIEIRGTPTFLSSGDFLWLSDLPGGRTHLYRINANTGERLALTSGAWDVDEVKSISTDQRYVFVTGNPTNPIEKHLLAVDLIQGSMRQVTTAPGTHQVNVDPTGSYYFDTFSNITTPPLTTLHRVDGSLVRVVSAKASDRHEYFKMRPPELLTIPARDGLPLQAMLLLPPNLPAQIESSDVKKLPVLFHVYGGPQAPTVNNSWQQGNFWWHQSLCARGYAVVLCDNRSARGRGVGDTWTIRGDLGRVELQDLEDAVAWVKQQPWADAERVGVWGWSYGGYFTAYAMTHSKLFTAGISGAPVTDWRNYDAIYTERYMDLPQSNQQGYQSSSVVSAAENLHGRLLLIHGERDDNVHVSNTIQLIDALQDANKQFDLMIYPKSRHGVVDPKKRYQMYQMMTEFLDRHLKGDG